jgi:hypothetical protein
MVKCGNAGFKDRQVCKIEAENLGFRSIPSFCKWSLRWLTIWIQKMESEYWYKNAGNSSEYPKIVTIIPIWNIERQKENM